MWLNSLFLYWFLCTHILTKDSSRTPADRYVYPCSPAACHWSTCQTPSHDQITDAPGGSCSWLLLWSDLWAHSSHPTSTTGLRTRHRLNFLYASLPSATNSSGDPESSFHGSIPKHPGWRRHQPHVQGLF